MYCLATMHNITDRRTDSQTDRRHYGCHLHSRMHRRSRRDVVECYSNGSFVWPSNCV